MVSTRNGCLPQVVSSRSSPGGRPVSAGARCILCASAIIVPGTVSRLNRGEDRRRWAPRRTLPQGTESPTPSLSLIGSARSCRILPKPSGPSPNPRLALGTARAEQAVRRWSSPSGMPHPARERLFTPGETGRHSGRAEEPVPGRAPPRQVFRARRAKASRACRSITGPCAGRGSLQVASAARAWDRPEGVAGGTQTPPFPKGPAARVGRPPTPLHARESLGTSRKGRRRWPATGL